MSPSCPGAPEPWCRALVGMQMNERCRCLGVCRRGGGRGIPQPVPARLASARWAQGSPIRGEGRRGDTATVKCVTRRQMSPPPSAAACEVAGGALRGTEGMGGTVTLGERLSLCGAGTPILTTGSCGDREGAAIDRGAEQGSMGCSREAATGSQTGVGEGSCVGVSHSRSSVCPYPLSTTMAVPLVTRTRPQLPVRWEHLLGERRSQPLPRVHSGDKHPTAQMGYPDCAGRHFPHCPHTSSLPPSCLHIPCPLPAPQQGGSLVSLSTSAHPSSPASLGVFTGRMRSASDNSFPILSPEI